MKTLLGRRKFILSSGVVGISTVSVASLGLLHKGPAPFKGASLDENALNHLKKIIFKNFRLPKSESNLVQDFSESLFRGDALTSEHLTSEQREWALSCLLKNDESDRFEIFVIEEFAMSPQFEGASVYFQPHQVAILS